ncbi:hypothetical protein NFI96_016138 [Prochilodus magdalenae]|nr:hypothetical protein NFI96_016138 [Prochilodus magdalenae]
MQQSSTTKKLGIRTNQRLTNGFFCWFYVYAVLERMLEELQHFLKILDGEYLSGNATVKKDLLTDLLQSYKSSNGGDEEYIYMNKVIVTGQNQDKTDRDNRAEAEANGRAGKHVSAPQKSLPELPPPRAGMIALKMMSPCKKPKAFQAAKKRGFAGESFFLYIVL